MIAFEVSLNGKRVCVAGMDDLAVLSTIIAAGGKLGPKTTFSRPGDASSRVYYSVGGLTGRKNPSKDVHVSWKSVTDLAVGDVLQVRVLETDIVDKPKRRKNAEKNRLRDRKRMARYRAMAKAKK